MRICNCGDKKSGYFAVTFTDEEGNVTERKETGNKIDYSEFYGQVIITLADESGEQLKTVVVTAQEKPVEPTEPDTPVVPDEPTEPTTPDEPNVPDEPNTDITETEKGGNGVAVALFVILVALALGGVAGFVIFKKIKNKKNGGNK